MSDVDKRIAIAVAEAIVAAEFASNERIQIRKKELQCSERDAERAGQDRISEAQNAEQTAKNDDRTRINGKASQTEITETNERREISARESSDTESSRKKRGSHKFLITSFQRANRSVSTLNRDGCLPI